MFKKLSKIRIDHRWFPLLLLLICIAAFGVLLPWLGLYWDDWEPIQVLKLYGLERIWDYFRADRPLSGWTYAVSAPILGTSVLGWQIFAFLLRFATCTTMYFLLNILWKNQQKWNALAVILFSIYPIFRQQSIAVSYHQHWLGYFLVLLSMYLMLLSLTKNNQRWMYSAAAILTQILHLAIFEYFIGLGLLRPLLIFLILRKSGEKLSKQIWQTLKNWLPYLIVISAYTIWRMFLVNMSASVNDPVLLREFGSQPLSVLLSLAQIILEDLHYLLVSSWKESFAPLIIDSINKTDLAFLFISVLAGLAVFIFFYFLKENEENTDKNRSDWWREALILGIGALILGSLPVWITGRQAAPQGMFSDRFGLAAMFGTALLFSALLAWLSRSFKRNTLLVSILVFLAVNFHLNTANTFRWNWIKQERVYWQLYWRAPSVEYDTIFLAEYPFLGFVYPTFAFNTLYEYGSDPSEQAYTFRYLAEINSVASNALSEPMPYKNSFRYFDFSGNTTDNLFLHYQPENGSNCLWVLSAEDANNPYLSEYVKDALPQINLERINPEMRLSTLAPEIFGSEPQHDWCYYYQKGQLARQFADWEETASLADQAREMGFTPNTSGSRSPQEWLGFIEAYGHLGRWDEAVQLSLQSYAQDAKYQVSLCTLWKTIQTEINITDSAAAAQQIFSELDCN